MRHRVHFLVVLSAILVGGSAFAAQIQPTGESVAGEVLVKIRSNASNNDVANIHSMADVDQSERVANVKAGAIWRMHSRSKNTEALATALQKNPHVEYAEPNFLLRLSVTPNDTSYAQLWGLKNTGQSIGGVAGVAGADIDAEAAWGVTTGSASIVVGVVDTGVNYNHVDLAANMWSNPGGKGNVTCAAGTHGFNAITKTCDPMDDHSHGTHVAGTIGAVGNNGLGVTGVNWTTSIMALKFLGYNGSGTTANAIAAIEFAIQAKLDGVNVRVLSNSWGGVAFSKALLDVINKANENNILFVASAGNSSLNNDTSPHYPSSYGTPNMISVAATDNRDGLASFSNYGPTTVHLGAPGVDVLSTVYSSSYTWFSGTSMAAPHVSGVAALLLANTPGLTTAQVKSAILNNTDPILSLSGKTITGGRLNAAKVVGAPLAPEFTVAASPSSRSVTRGSAASYNVTISPANGFSGSVNLTVTGLPTGASGSFSPNPATSSSTLTVQTSNSTPLSTVPLTITGTSGALTHATSVSLTTTAVPVVTACGTFSSGTFHTVGTSPHAVAAGDFNRDGRIDLVAANSSSNSVSVLIGNGSTFSAAQNYIVGNSPVGVAVGDFDGDGRDDLAVANASSNNVSILLGAGSGSFQSAVHYSAGSNPFWVSTGDFDSDGNLDLAVANNGSSNVSILAGQGDGTFEASVQYSTGSGAFWVAVGDFNRDGRSDLAVAAYNAAKVSVLLGNGDSTFQSKVDYSVGSGPASVAVGDFNRDGKADLAVSNFVSNNISILAGDGAGAFSAAVNYAVGNGPYSVAVLDANSDGKPDVAVANSESDSVSILSGNGDGTFAGAGPYTTGYNPVHVFAGDVNGDGRADLVVSHGEDNDISVFKNTGFCSMNCSTFAAAVPYTAGTAPQSVAVGDFNGDGRLDLATANNGAGSVSIAMGNADGTFQTAVDYSAGSTPRAVKAADLNGDGRLDLAVANNDTGQVSILLGNADGTFQGAVGYGSGTNPHSITVGDFNRDGRADVAVANRGSNNVSVLLGNGNGTLQTAVDYAVGTQPESVALGDINRDGKADLAVANSGSANVSMLFGNGNGTFQPAANFNAGTTPFAVVIADLNGDAKPDVAVANSGSNNVSILLGNGTSTLQAAVHYGAGTNPYGLAAGDLNDDGTSDLAVANQGSNNVSILRGNGDGTFAAATHNSVGTTPYAVVAGDFNRDGRPDLAVANSGSTNVSVLLNTCPVPDLTITKTHTGNFAQGATGKTYTITVTNAGPGPTTGSVTVIDTLPLGLTATAMSGSGWSCTVATATCSRGDVLAGGASYAPITLTVRVASSAPTSVTNTVTVSGGGEVNVGNNSTSDPTTVTPVTDVIVSSQHAGSFTQGATGRVYKLTVKNAGGAATSGTITVTDTLPAGLTATAMAGTGWSCTLATRTCTRSDVLAGGASYPVINLTVNVSTSAPSLVTNTVTVSGGGDAVPGNNTDSDPTTIWSSDTCAAFGVNNSYTVGSNPKGIASGDFNGDGKIDLAAANSYSNTVSVLIGSGTGTFAAAVSYAVGTYPRSVAVTDLNSDDKPDLIVTNEGADNVSVLIGNGDGTFAAAVSYGAGQDPGEITVNDFNNDGNADVTVTDYYSGSLIILLGTGNGSFQTALNRSVGGAPSAVISADFDGDGKVDLVSADYYDDDVLMLRGNGDGTFQTAVRYAVGYDPVALARGDFNGDGKIDLAVARSYNGGLTILLGNGDATFQPGVTHAAPYSYSSWLIVDDFNGDGKDDVALTVGSSDGITLMLGNGDATFQPAASLHTDYGPSRHLAGDFNGDGRADFAFTGNGVRIMLGGCPELTITKSHTGNFLGGQSNAVYTLTVKNNGAAGTRGAITVREIPPAGLSVIEMSSWDWNWECDLPSLTCTKNNSLEAGNTSTIFVNVSVSETAPSSVTNQAVVSGGADPDSSNNTASDPTTIVQAPDLTITKTHQGTFARGQTGKTYTIFVGNSGGAPTSGTVTVVEQIPYGLTLTNMAGPGWSCNPDTRTCTRSDALAVNEAYPPITVTVDVNNDCPSSVTNYANVFGGGEIVTGNNWVQDPTRVLSAPVNLVATAIFTTQVSLTWSTVPFATAYEVLRRGPTGSYVVIGTPVTNAFVDASLNPNATYLYLVRAIDNGTAGPFSNLELATTIIFTDDPLVPNATPMKPLHITQLRTAVNSVRAAAALPPATFTDPSLAGVKIKAIHLKELRTALDPARSALGLAPIPYTDPALAAGHRIKAAHLTELRTGVK